MLSKVVDYSILKADAPDELAMSVKQAMEDSWVPSGPLLLDKGNYLQTMVKFGR